MRLPATRTLRALAVAGVTALTVPLGAGPAAAAGSAYGRWSPGALTVPAPGFPGAAVTSDAAGLSTPSGNSAFLGGGTPFGAVYGSSRGHNYLALGSAAGARTSDTTVTFDSPAPPGWGFALGDVDADTVRVTATGPDGVPLTAAQLGWQSSFNYCAAGSPKPPACTGGGPFTDLPSWNAGTATLVGGGSDTSGAAGWFRPTAPVVSLSLRFTVQTGVPVYQVWLAAPTADIAGRVRSECGGLPDRTTLELRAADGADPLLTTTAGPDGSYSFPGVATGPYRVTVHVPAGYTASGPTSRTADPSDGDDAHSVDFRLTCTPTRLPAVDVPPGGAPVEIPVVADADPSAPVDVTAPPQGGTVTLRDGSTLVYVPRKGFSGTDTFVYRVTAKDGRTRWVEVTLNVLPRLRPTPPTGRPGPPARPPHAAGPQLAATGATTNGLLPAAAFLTTGVLTVTAARASTRRRR